MKYHKIIELNAERTKFLSEPVDICDTNCPIACLCWLCNMFTWHPFNLDHLKPRDTITWQNLFHVTWSRGFQSVKYHFKTFRSSRQHYCKTNSKRHIHTGLNLEILNWNFKVQIITSKWINFPIPPTIIP